MKSIRIVSILAFAIACRAQTGGSFPPAGGAATVDASSMKGANYVTLASGNSIHYVGSPSQCPTSLGLGQVYTIVWDVTNTTGNPDLALCGFLAKTITNSDGSALVFSPSGQLDTGSQQCQVTYDGTKFLLGKIGCSVGPSYFTMQHIAAASVPNAPAAGQFNAFFNSSNSDHFSRVDSVGGLVDMQAGGSGPLTSNCTPTFVGYGICQVTLSSAQLLSGAEVHIITAPGAGLFTRVLAITTKVNFGTVAYTGAGHFVVCYTQGGNCAIGSLAVLDAAGNLPGVVTAMQGTASKVIVNIQSITTGTAFDPTIVLNAPIDWKNTSTAFAAGDGNVVMLIEYCVIPVA